MHCAVLPCGCLVEVLDLEGALVLGLAACGAADDCEILHRVRVCCNRDYGITRAIIYV